VIEHLKHVLNVLSILNDEIKLHVKFSSDKLQREIYITSFISHGRKQDNENYMKFHNRVLEASERE
jgi:hypothetical protein